MSDPFSLAGLSSWDVVGGTPGVVSPWANQGGTFQGTLQSIQSGAASIVKNAPTLGSDPTMSLQGIIGNPAGDIIPGASNSGTATGTNTAGAAAASLTTAINSYFIRAVVVILGFIFVAAGLALLGKGPLTAVISKEAIK